MDYWDAIDVINEFKRRSNLSVDDENVISAIQVLLDIIEDESPQSKGKVCHACNGSGYYDSTGSPKCSACEGTGHV